MEKEVYENYIIAYFSCVTTCLFSDSSQETRKQKTQESSDSLSDADVTITITVKHLNPLAKVLTASGRERRRILYTNVTGCASPIHICKRRGTSCIQLSLLPR